MGGAYFAGARDEGGVSERFEIGEIAIYIGGDAWHGCELRIVAGPLEVSCFHTVTKQKYRGVGYVVNFDDGDGDYPCPAHELRKKKPPALDRECYRVTSWDDGAWRPREVETV